ncbi:rubrerythrin family protein [Halostella sp. JP-L12]|uniref:rubrerythrin family protein n=1 Tax=Halostella TaxID=1843185 RepID=UPI000EF7E9F5|nr:MULTISPECIES: rubrerythrin family protein [Halostella]NHN46228.1 rubrerythrin family protein [Halostella sp. JP-L12]
MNADDFLDRIRDENETALSRLGSSKALYALTDGEMEADAVLTAAADGAHAAAETFEEWAGESDIDGFDEVAAAEHDHYETLAGKLDDHEAGGTPAIQVYLRGLDGDVARVAGGLIGAALAEKKRATQMSGFFTGEADPQTASLFRGYGSDLEDRWSGGLDALEEVCESDDDRERATEAASGAIQAAYDDYVEKLEAMGVNPKPVC